MLAAMTLAVRVEGGARERVGVWPPRGGGAGGVGRGARRPAPAPPHAGGDKVEGKTLRPVDPVVVRVAQEARRAIVRGGVVVEHRLILGPAVPGAGNVQGVVDKEVGKPGIRAGG